MAKKKSSKTKEKLKERNGITLIALVITIIVLLILAGVTIASITGENGILGKAQSAKIKNEKASIQEEIERAVLASRMNDNVKIDTTTLEEELNKIDGLTIESKGTDDNLPWTVVVKGYRFQITEDGQVEAINGISLSPTKLKMVEGQSPVKITATLTEGVTGNISWSTSNANVATVNNGEVTAVGTSGSATITAKVDGTDYSAECVVTIVSKVTQITITPSTVEVEQGNTQDLTVTTQPAGTDIEDLEYKSSDTTGKITVNQQGRVTVAEDATVGATATITVTGKSSGTTGTCTITVKQAKLPIGEYVEYNVSYTDMYVSDIDTETEGNQGFTSKNGWRILDQGTKNADGSYSGAKIISTGIPTFLRYDYHTAYDGSTINESNKPSWWGTREQVAELYDSTHADAGYIDESSNSGGYPSYYAATGLFKTFESIPFEQKTWSLITYNKGGYASIINNGNSASGEINGEIFKTEKASEVHNLTLAELNKAINKISGSNRSEDSTNSIPQSIDLFYLKGLSNFNYSSKYPHYWLASPSYARGLSAMFSTGNIGGDGTSTLGCRVVVSLNSNIHKDGDIWKIK